MTASHDSRTIYALSILQGGVHAIDPVSGSVSTLMIGSREAPDGIAIDRERGRAVVSLMGEPDDRPSEGEPSFERRNGAIIAVPLDGGAPTTLVARGTFTTGKQLTIEAASGRIYWADREGRALWCCEADGTEPRIVIDRRGTGPSAIEEQCVGIAIDSEAGSIYWTQKGPAKGGKGRIFRAKLADDGSLARDSEIETLWQLLPEPIDLELDLAAGVLSWTDRGAGPDGNSLNRAAIPAPGSDGEPPRILARGFHEAIGLAVDEERGVVYVSDLSGRIVEVSVDDGGIRELAQLDGGVTGLELA